MTLFPQKSKNLSLVGVIGRLSLSVCVCQRRKHAKEKRWH